MAIHFSALPGILLKPTETFNRLKGEANLSDGLKLYLVMMVLAVVIEMIITSVYFFSFEGAREGMHWFYGDLWPLILIGLGLVNYIVGFVIFLFICGFTAKMSSALSRSPLAFGGITYMLSYTGAAFFLFIILPITIIGMFLPVSFLRPMDIINYASGGVVTLGLVVSLILTILICLWELLVAGKAVAIGRDRTWGNGILSVMIGVGITTALTVAIVMAINAVIWMSYY